MGGDEFQDIPSIQHDQGTIAVSLSQPVEEPASTKDVASTGQDRVAVDVAEVVVESAQEGRERLVLTWFLRACQKFCV